MTDTQLFKRLADATRHAEPFVRADAARQLGLLRDRRAVDALAAMLDADPAYSKIAAVYALGHIGTAKAARALRKCAADPRVFDMPGFYNHDMIRLAAVLALLWNDDDTGYDHIGDLMLEDQLEAYVHLAAAILELPDNPRNAPLRGKITRDYLMRRHRQENSAIHGRITAAMGVLGGAAARRFIVEQLQHVSRYVRAEAARALLRLKRSDANIKAVEAMLRRERTAFVKLKTTALLHAPGDRRAPRLVRQHIEGDDPFVRATALDVLATLHAPDLADLALARLADDDAYVRLCAVEALASLGADADAAPLDDDDPRVRLAATRWLLQRQPTPALAGA